MSQKRKHYISKIQKKKQWSIRKLYERVRERLISETFCLILIKVACFTQTPCSYCIHYLVNCTVYQLLLLLLSCIECIIKYSTKHVIYLIRSYKRCFLLWLSTILHKFHNNIHKYRYLIKNRTVWLILPGQNKNRFCKINNTFDIIDHLDARPLLKLSLHLAENWMESERFCGKH